MGHDLDASFFHTHNDFHMEKTDLKPLIGNSMIDLIYKIQCCGITGKPLRLKQNFLKNRYQRVILNGQTSAWVPVFAGVPQRSIMGPLFFLFVYTI